MGYQPINIFNQWYQAELLLSSREAVSACCLSTCGLDGYPNARFVALKDIFEDQLIITGTLTSLKGREILNNNRVAVTFWWPQTKKQVRFQGTAHLLDNDLSNKYFLERSRDSQMASIVSNQGMVLESMEDLNNKYLQLFENNKINVFSRPINWGGYKVRPHRIELFEFKESRFHLRSMFYIENMKWLKAYLQP